MMHMGFGADSMCLFVREREKMWGREGVEARTDHLEMTHCTLWLFVCLTPLSHERLVANAHELGTSQDSLQTSQDGLGCVLARPYMSRQVTETEREIPFFSHRLVAAVDFILSREIEFSPPPATKMQLNCIGPSRLVPAS